MLRSPVVVLIVMLLAAASVAAQGSSPAQPGLQWMPAPALVPRGAQMAVLSGDPFKPVVLKVLLSMPDGYRMPPAGHLPGRHGRQARPQEDPDEPWGVFPYGY